VKLNNPFSDAKRENIVKVEGWMMDWWVNVWMDGCIDRQTDRQTDR
jgi:hypothetical protein